ncbi:MAG: ATP-binding protein [Lentimicrobiaceae bacterium]|nr:ATP-binding protein [Lentimicrobiaceae bacterium]
MNQDKIIPFLSRQIVDTISTGLFSEIPDELREEIEKMDRSDIGNLLKIIVRLYDEMSEANEFVGDIAVGKLSSKPPLRNNLISSYKQLHSNLLHLTWQVKQLSEGDLEQKVDFLGDFSVYFNMLIESLKEKRTYEHQLRESAETIRIAVENANIGIMTVDLSGYIQTTNKECVNIFGYTQKELENKNVNDIAVPEDYHISKSFMEQAKLDKMYSKADFIKRYYHKSGQIITCQISSSLMFDDDDSPMFFISHVKDITHLIESEKKLKNLNLRYQETIDELKQSNAAKDKLSRIIGHDLKNHFSSILGFSEFLIENVHTDPRDQLESYASVIYQASLNAYRLLENLLDWSLAQSGKFVFNPQKLDFEAVIKEIFAFAGAHAKSKKISLTSTVHGSPVIFADANMLRTILRNLIGNALKFTDESGKVEVIMNQHTDHTLIQVSDTGVGIEAQEIGELFTENETTPFYNKSGSKGTGLGLSLCKEFVDKHKGDIRVESTPGKGSTFSFTLPVDGKQQKFAFNNNQFVPL